MNKNYVEIDENNIVIGVFMTTEEVKLPNIISIEIYDESLLNKKYVDGEFIDVDPEPEEE